MLVIPFAIGATEYSVFIVLQDENIERIKDYDPAEVPNVSRLPSELQELRLKDVLVGYATDEDVAFIERCAREGRPADGLRHLSRGFRYRPDHGDHDRGPERLDPHRAST